MARRYTYNLTAPVASVGRLGALGCYYRAPVVPGDTMSGGSSLMYRFQPLREPLQIPMVLDEFLFYVPHRIVWDKWPEFIMNGQHADDFPTVGAAKSMAALLGDGTTSATDGSPVGRTSALLQRSYNLIWNRFFRDPDRSERDLDTDIPRHGAYCYQLPSTLLTALQSLYTEGQWQTAEGQGGGLSLPNPDDGSDRLGLMRLSSGDSGSGQVTTTMVWPDNDDTGEGIQFDHTFSALLLAYRYLSTSANAPSPAELAAAITALGAGNPSGVNVEKLRQQLMSEYFADRRAHFGPEYEDYLKSMGVDVPRSTIDVPELLSHERRVIDTVDVVSTSEQGEKKVGGHAGYAVASSRVGTKRAYFNEHGYVIGVNLVRMEPIFKNAVPMDSHRHLYENGIADGNDVPTALGTWRNGFYDPSRVMHPDAILVYDDFAGITDGTGTEIGRLRWFDWLRMPEPLCHPDVTSARAGVPSYGATAQPRDNILWLGSNLNREAANAIFRKNDGSDVDDNDIHFHLQGLNQYMWQRPVPPANKIVTRSPMNLL